MPLRQALHRLTTARRMTIWSVEIGRHGLKYEPRRAIKAQALVNFIAERSFNDLEKKGEDENQQKRTSDPLSSSSPRDTYEWDLYVDGSACLGGAKVGIVLKGLQSFLVNMP